MTANNTPKIGAQYLWIDYSLLVTITDCREKKIPAKECQDGSLYGGGTEYSIEIEYIDKKGVACKHWTPFTSYSFKEKK
jgi:hypothetical protein